MAHLMPAKKTTKPKPEPAPEEIQPWQAQGFASDPNFGPYGEQIGMTSEERIALMEQEARAAGIDGSNPNYVDYSETKGAA
jgi:hypothetical protein